LPDATEENHKALQQCPFYGHNSKRQPTKYKSDKVLANWLGVSEEWVCKSVGKR